MKTGMKKLTAIFIMLIFVISFALTGCAKVDNGTYTYRLAVNSLPTSWNIHTYQSNDATYILDYTEDGFYGFDYNDNKDGYKLVLAMAAEWPQDVSSTYVGDDWGISEGEEWRAVRVVLRQDLKFDTGRAITAQDFVESIKLLLDPDAANYRADSVYGGQFSLVGAEKYLKGGKTIYEDVTGGEGVLLNENGESDWGNVSDEVANSLVFVINNSYVGQWAITEYGDTHTPAYVFAALFGETITEEDVNALEGKTLAEILADATLNATLEELFAGWCTDPGEEFGFFCESVTWPEYDFANVGIKAVDDYTLDFILEKSLSGFYLTYNLMSSMYLVDTELYKSCVSESQGAYTNSYGTSVETYTGFGPYKLKSYIADNSIELEKNEYWYGYNDKENKDLYQTTNISYRQVAEASTRLNMFLNGELDSYGLQATDMETYQSSEYTYYTDGDSTWFVALNPDYNALAASQAITEPVVSGRVVNKTILTIKEFRQALSFAIDRAAYELALDPTGSVAKALYGNMIISDPDNGTAYRTTDAAKQAIVEFWGLADEIGEGKEYATIDEAIASITGYDPAGAKEYFTAAYNQAVELGYIDPNTDWEVQIMIGQPGSGGVAYYNDGYEFLSKAWTDAVVGTPLEGRLTFKQSAPLGSTGFSAYLKSNEVNVLFGVAWTGSALDPYSLMEAYVSPNYQYDPGWDTTTRMLDIEIDGKVLRASVYDWGYAALQGNTITAKVVANGEVTDETVEVNAGTSAPIATRLAILAAVEGAVLNQYDMIPVGCEASAALKSMRINFYTEEYVYGMGRGGVKYMTYSYNDEDWASYVTEQGGTLNYR